MGTKVQIDSYMPGLCSMRDLSRESNGASWPPYYVDSNFTNGEYYAFRPISTHDLHSGYDKDVVKQTMLKHEVIFKNQVFELHRLYQVQRDLMYEVTRKEQIKRRIPYETSSSSSPVFSHMQHEDMRRCNNQAFPLANSVSYRSIPGTVTIQSSTLSIKGKIIQASPSLYQNYHSPKNSEVSESRPTKCMRKMIDLQLPGDKYIDPDEVEQFGDKNKYLCENGNTFLNSSVKTECRGDAPRSDSYVTKSGALADLNEPLHVEETTVVSSIDLNVPYSNGVSYDQTSQPGLKVVNNNKSKDPLVVLPWLRGNGSCCKETEISNKGHPFVMISYDDNVKHKNEDVGGNWRKGGFDMNRPCEPSDSELDTMNGEVVVIEKRTQNESGSVRNRFDLNSCVTEEESPCGSASIKGETGIDLEAPLMVESDEDEVHLTKDREEKHPELLLDRTDNGETELATSAAEMIVAISSSVSQNQSLTESTFIPLAEVSEEEMLRWFVDIACTNGNDPENHTIPNHEDDNDRDQNCSPVGSDDYESMILRLKECTFEEYFPKPTIPEFPNMEENGPCVLTTRICRKRHTRRVRQRRDFQRDILPGLTSLSRNEVTEDLQTFGGIMRGTGHYWHSAPNRRNATRNGCGRGRRRSVVVASAPAHTGFSPSKQVSSSNMEVVLEDRCLIGWGKTTRRPRRHRYPPCNLPPPLLSS